MSTHEPTTPGSYLRGCRTKKRIGLRKMAGFCSIPPTRLTQIEIGELLPPDAIIEKFIELTDCDRETIKGLVAQVTE